MKAILLIFSLSIALLGCDVESPMQQMANNNPDAQARMIAAQYGCMGCHIRQLGMTQ